MLIYGYDLILEQEEHELKKTKSQMETACCSQTHFCLREKFVALVAGKNVLAQKVLFFMALWKSHGCALSFCSLLYYSKAISCLFSFSDLYGVTD